MINEDTEHFRRMAERRPAVDSGNEIGEASRLTFRERWRIEAEGLDLTGTRLCGQLTLVSARGFMLGVESDSGSVLWRRETDRSEAMLQMAGRDGVVRVAPSGQVDMLDIESGVLRWRADLAARSGGSPVLLVVDHGPVPGLVLVAEEERKLVALLWICALASPGGATPYPEAVALPCVATGGCCTWPAATTSSARLTWTMAHLSGASRIARASTCRRPSTARP
ncbi:MAG: PQQ-binding-like beta-propeller repeat protein [Deltaproteobacteria bacterium]|nr:PQQ-binding-like beta-propeller repeat protein [Deltaproteobacteria bacterium]